MSKQIQIKRGRKAGLPLLNKGEIALLTDTKNLVIGTDLGNKVFGADAGTWITPIVNFTETNTTSVKFTITNEADVELTIKYGLNSIEENSIILNGRSTSSVLEFTGLTPDTLFTLYAQSFLLNTAVSLISEYLFVTPEEVSS